MAKKNPTSHEEDDSLDFILGVGFCTGFTEIPKNDKPKRKRRIGFIQDVQQITDKAATTRKRKTAKGNTKKGSGSGRTA